MGINSMTGFARSEGTPPDDSRSGVWELRSVNGKGWDIRLRLPPGQEGLESKVRQMAANQLNRGNLNISLAVAYKGSADGYQINQQFLDTLIALAANKAADLPGGVGPATLDGLMAVKGVVEASDPSAKTEDEQSMRIESLLGGLDQALVSLVRARQEEGQHLSETLTTQLSEMESLTAAASNTAASQPDALRARLKAQVDALLDGSSSLPEERLAQEAAVLATKADVREELDRLAAHIAQGRDLVTKGSPCGRRLEFLSQEFNREANTLCSKSTDGDLTRIGLDLKAVIDQFREQIQNVE